ncbi:MAG: polymer-forming cytoskeletal protein [Deltaproteobacteria bacterium]|nr:polymer-forming cytoskeletal protein [Deltaproteobacteria bacterium]
MGNNFKTTSFISDGVELNGNLQIRGGIRIDGSIKGTLKSESGIFIGSTAKIEAEIQTVSLVSSGTIIGNIIADDTVKINNPGTMKGKITTCNLGIDKDVFFNGKCQLINPKNIVKPSLQLPKLPRKSIPNRD